MKLRETLHLLVSVNIGKEFIEHVSLPRATERLAVEMFMKGDCVSPEAEVVRYALAAFEAGGYIDNDAEVPHFPKFGEYGEKA